MDGDGGDIMERKYTFSQRIKQLMDLHDINQSELAKIAGINKSNISRYIKGEYEAKQDVIYSIAKRFNVNESWLMGCDVPMYDKQETSNIIPLTQDREIDRIWNNLNEDGQTSLCEYGNFLLGQGKYRAKETPKRPVVITRIIPLLGQSFAAGSPETPGDLFMQDYHTTDPRAEFAIHVNGNSMEPYLADGSVALGIKRKPMDGEVGAFWLDGGFLVKQVCQDSQGNIYLFSLNRERDDADETIWHDSGRDLRCVGTILMDEKVPLP